MSISTITEEVRTQLSNYLADVSQPGNESAKVQRFVVLLSNLFPTVAPSVVKHSEKVVLIDTGARRRIDVHYGHAVLEFERSLKSSLRTAEGQLREQAAGLWNQEGAPRRRLMAVATDGVDWRVYRTRALSEAVTIGGTDVALDLVDSFVVSPKTFRHFYLFLLSWLFRPNSVFPSADQFRMDFGPRSPVYFDAAEALDSAWTATRDLPHHRLLIEQWAKSLTVAYGSLDSKTATRSGDLITPELEALFRKHTYLASIARMLVWAALSEGSDVRDGASLARRILSGEAFREFGLANLVEDDFFQWVHQEDAARTLEPFWEGVLSHLRTYDLSHLGQDVLKSVYQDLIDPEDRHDLGEFYTPEWLCERVVEEVLPNSGFPSVLDPTCGSGSFLRASIAHILRANPGASQAESLSGILANVRGIDIHPLAVTVSRATYAIAIRDLVRAERRSVEIPVYLADALFVPAAPFAPTLQSRGGIPVDFGGKTVTLPLALVEDAEMLDAGLTAAKTVAEAHATNRRETKERLRTFLQRGHAGFAAHPEAEDILSALWDFTDDLAQLIREDRDSIWPFVLRNAYRPGLLKNQFDYIVGNPPWLSYRYIKEPQYQKRVRQRAVERYKIAPKSAHLFTQMELATVFLMHALEHFGTSRAKLGFVMPRAVLTADQHTNLRTRAYTARVLLESIWDLMDVSVVFNVPSCVLFARRGQQPLQSHFYELPGLEWSGKLTERNYDWSEVSERLTATPRTFRLGWLGDRNALTTAVAARAPGRASSYAPMFSQGATIVPRNCYFVNVKDRDDPPRPDRDYWCITDPEQAKTAKKPWTDVELSGRVEGPFLYTAAISKHVMPFAILDPADVVLPLKHDTKEMRLATVKQLEDDGYRNVGQWFGSVEKTWKRKRGTKQESTYLEWLDYQGKLTNQNPRAPFRVVYNAAGTDISAARVPRGKRFQRFVVDAKLYWAQVQSAAEANYLVAFLNAPVVNKAIKPFQSQGLMGARDIHKKVLELPIPRFDSHNAAHQELSALGELCADKAAAVVRAADFPPSLARQRGVVRASLRKELTEIDRLAKRLLAGRD